MIFLTLMVRFAMQGLWLPLVAHFLLCIFRLGSYNPRLIASDDICEGSIVVFSELYQHLFEDSYPGKFLLLCKEMGYPSDTYPSHF
jgi:hypothetical protein